MQRTFRWLLIGVGSILLITLILLGALGERAQQAAFATSQANLTLSAATEHAQLPQATQTQIVVAAVTPTSIESTAAHTDTPTLTPTSGTVIATPATDYSIMTAAFNITAGFEGGSYDYYVITSGNSEINYGRFASSLSSGALYAIVAEYVSVSNSATANQLETDYLALLEDQAPSLVADTNLRDLLVRAAAEPAMQFVQDSYVETAFWNRTYSLSIEPRGIETALGQALLFDMAINHGLFHDITTVAENNLGVEPHSHVGENGITEEQLIAEIVRVRQERLTNLAEQFNMTGLQLRADFWVAQVEAGNWDLHGDANGLIEIRPGRLVEINR